MLHLMKTEWKKVYLPVLLVILVITITACVLTSTLYRSYTIIYKLDAWEIGTEFFGLLYPLFTVLPLCWSMYYERKNSFLLYVLPRVSIRKYLSAKWLVYAISAFCIITIPYILSAAAALYVAPIVPYTPEGYMAPFTHVFLDAYTEHPLIYAAVLSCWKGLIGILVMTMGFVIAMYCKNVFVILTGPFMYGILENFILSILGLPEYRLITAFEPTSVSHFVVSTASFMIGPMLAILVTLLIALYWRKIKKNEVVQV